MRLHLENGTHRSVPLHSNMAGLRITGVTFGSRDVHELRRLTDVQMFDFLNQLSNRFVQVREYEEHQLAPFPHRLATPRSEP